mmetsp:Transcript_69070/g.200411  ORF Transcript_69070/g.200411 Transcript_69070/m.200411 type:complete len:227 (-) Transcript_69070:802-1482(-)
MLRTSSASPLSTASKSWRSRCRCDSAAQWAGKHSTISRIMAATTPRSSVRWATLAFVAAVATGEPPHDAAFGLALTGSSPPQPPVFVALSVDAAENFFLSNSLKNSSNDRSKCSTPALAASRSRLEPARISSTTPGEVEKHVLSKCFSSTIAPLTIDTKRSRYTQPRSPHFVAFLKPIGARRNKALCFALPALASSIFAWSSARRIVPQTSMPSSCSTKSNCLTFP